jgi:hypothetical protein
MISILIGLLVAAVVIYILWLILSWIFSVIALPQQLKNIIFAILGLIVLLWLLGFLGVYSLPPGLLR